MNVRDVMTTEVITVLPGASVAQVARVMIDRGLSGVPVATEAGRMVGLVTESDVVAKHMIVHTPTYLGILGYAVPWGQGETEEELRRALAVTAEDLMERDAPTIRPDADIDEAATIMVEEHANPLPVVDNGRLVGIVTATDIIRLVLKEEDGEQPAQ